MIGPRSIALRSWALVGIAATGFMTVSACALAQDQVQNPRSGAALSCQAATPAQISAYSREQAAAAEAILARLRTGPLSPGKVIEIKPSDDHGDSAVIERALQQARAARAETGEPATLVFAPGRYFLQRPITLTAADSGVPGAPLRFAALPGGPVILSGGMPLARQPLPANLDGLLSAAQRNVVVGYAVPPQIVPTPPFPWRVGVGSIFTKLPSLFALQGDRPLWRSAMPGSGYAVEQVAHPQPAPTVAPQITVPPDLARVLDEPSLQAGGYWTYDWAYEENQLVPVPADLKQRGAQFLTMPRLRTRYPQASRMRYRLFNGFSFIDRPGAMAYANGALAAYPWPGGEPVAVAVIDRVVTIEGAHDIVFDGLALQGARQDVVAINDAHDITISNAYIGLAAQSGMLIRNSENITVERSVISDVGEYGVAIENNTQKASSHILIADNILTRNAQLTRANHPALLLSGYDNVAMGNAISDLPHQAIIFGGARNLILGNEIYKVDLEATDAGAIYAYHDLSNVNNDIEQNYFHDIALSSDLPRTGVSNLVHDIYLDSWTSFTNIKNNLSDTDADSYFFNSGSHNYVGDNIWFLNATPSGEIYNYSPHRHDPVGKFVFDDPKSRKLAGCSELSARYDPEFLRDGKPTKNVIANNFNIGGRSVVVNAALVSSQDISGERFLPAVRVDRRKGLAGLLGFAGQLDVPVGPYLQRADRVAALRTLKYASRSRL